MSGETKGDANAVDRHGLLFINSPVTSCQGIGDELICVADADRQGGAKHEQESAAAAAAAEPHRGHFDYDNELMKLPLEKTPSSVMHVHRAFVYWRVLRYLVKHFVHSVLRLKH